MTEFYNNIEPEIREVVRALRDNGINTTCSCGHELYIEADIVPAGELYTIDKLLFNYLVERGKEPKYTIFITRERNIAGLTRCWAYIKLGLKEEG